MSVHTVPFLFRPIVAFWMLLTFLLEAVGRLVAVLLGLVLMLTGSVLTLTVVGAPVGIPLAVLGFLVTVRAFF